MRYEAVLITIIQCLHRDRFEHVSVTADILHSLQDDTDADSDDDHIPTTCQYIESLVVVVVVKVVMMMEMVMVMMTVVMIMQYTAVEI